LATNKDTEAINKSLIKF